MFSNEMFELGSKSSVIRELYMYGRKKAAEIGKDKVYDFSLGSPSIPSTHSVKEAVVRILEEPDAHSYTPAAGHPEVRQAVADSIKKRFSIEAAAERVYMTCGAAASLTCSIRALTQQNDEWVLFAPFFPEYRCFIEAAGGVVSVSKPNKETMEIDFDDFDSLITEKTKGLIINSPNNPSGVVYSEESISKLAELLEEKSEEFGHPIYLIADEPYREIVYSNVPVPFIPSFYGNTIVCYSYSKSFSLAGERIGYIFVGNKVVDGDQIFAAICGAGRSMGFVCAPSLFQKVIAQCIDSEINISTYRKNRDLLYDALTSYGYECVKPNGAFYLFVKTLDEDAEAFCEYAKIKYNLLVVPSSSFCVEGYMRISYCVSTEMIERSLSSFKALAEEYK